MLNCWCNTWPVGFKRLNLLGKYRFRLLCSSIKRAMRCCCLEVGYKLKEGWHCCIESCCLFNLLLLFATDFNSENLLRQYIITSISLQQKILVVTSLASSNLQYSVQPKTAFLQMVFRETSRFFSGKIKFRRVNSFIYKNCYFNITIVNAT